MFVLSSYPLSRENNQRITERVEELGGRFLSTSFDESSEEIIERLNQHISEATVFLGGRLSQEQWDKADALQWIHVPWAGVNALFSLEGIERRSLSLTNSSGVMADSVADQVAAYLVMLNRNLAKQIRWMERRQWNRYTSVEHPDRRRLRGLTVGIVGYGTIGRAVAQRSRAFGMRVVATKRNVAPEPSLDHLYNPAELPKLLAESDFVVLTLPLTSETEGLFDAQVLSQMKSTAFLINVARGKIIRQNDLVEALEAGGIAGAALDVVEEEPLPRDSVLWGMENVIVTPHSSGGFVGFGSEVTDLFLDNINRFVAGEELRNPIDPRRGY